MNAIRQYVVPASPETAQWGYFDALRKPVLVINSGDQVWINTVSGVPAVTPENGYTVLPEHRAIHEKTERRQTPGHILTGPVYVNGAELGDTLEIRILDIELACDWGWNAIRPNGGTIPEDFPEERLMHIGLDKGRNIGKMPWGQEVELAPFFGVMGVAPPKERGSVTSIIPGDFGGNLDLKELTKGTTLFLPVFNEGALFSCGDGHAAQGNGEVCITAIETSLNGFFEIHVHKGETLTMPRAETLKHYICTGINPDLDEAAKQALREMIKFITERTPLSAADAYSLCSITCDMNCTQLVNQHKGVHAMLPKEVLAGAAG